MESDEFFAVQMRRAGNVILAVPPDLTPPSLFLTNAFALGDIATHKDYPEGVLRRAQAFRVIRKWHFAFRQVAADPELRGGPGPGARGARPGGLAPPGRR